MCRISPGSGSRGVIAKSIHSVCPSTPTRASTMAADDVSRASGAGRSWATRSGREARAQPRAGRERELGRVGLGQLGDQRLRRREVHAHPAADRGRRDHGHRGARRRRRASSTCHGWVASATGPSGTSARSSPPPSSATTPPRAVPVEHRGAGEVGHEGGRRRRGELRRRPGLHDPAAVHHRDPVGEQRGLGEVVRDEEDRHARGADHARDLRRGRGARAGVERGERLVEQQHLGLAAPAPGRARRAGARRPTASPAARPRARPGRSGPSSARARGSRSARGTPSSP